MTTEEVFKEKIQVTKEEVVITVECTPRNHAGVRKRIYRKERILDLIPKELRDTVRLAESPDKRISNINSSDFSTFGRWRFEIVKKEVKKPPTVAKNKRAASTAKTTRTPTRRKRTATKK